MANFNFNVPKSSSVPGIGFGTQPQAAALPTFGNFNKPTNMAPPAFGLGGGTTNPLQMSSAPLGNLGTMAPPTTAPPPFSFGNFQATSTNANTPIMNFGTLPSTGTAASSFSGGIFGKPNTTGIGLTTTGSTSMPFVGLGGVDMSQTQPKPGDTKPDIIAKETQVPDEIVKSVEALKAHIKAQKTLASDIGRTSMTKLTNVSSETKAMLWSLQEISNAVASNYNQIKLLRQETSKTQQSVEIAQRTQDTPAGLQYENVAPFQFFLNLVTKYEQDLISFQQQITATEQHMRSLTNPRAVSYEELIRGMKQINECFISLAGRVQEIHQKVEAQKEQYLNLRKYRLLENTNVFAELEKPSRKFEAENIASGPTPFSMISVMTNFGKSLNNATAASAAGGSAK